MSKIKIAELFYSIQGEGRFTGAPSIFLRTFGCNFQCAGFGMRAGELSEEKEFIDPKQYRVYEELPLVHTGCDSYASWDVRFKHLSPMFTSDQLVTKINELLPKHDWDQEHLVITGGEPLLGWQRAYPDLLNAMPNLKYITFETNGTQELSEEFKDYLQDWQAEDIFSRDITFSVSAKLPCSGEKWEDAIKPEIVHQYEYVGHTYLKFVVSTEQDVADAERAVAEYRAAGFRGDIYIMPVGGTADVYNLNTRQVAELAMKKGWKYSPRLQVDIWRNAWGT